MYIGLHVKYQFFFHTLMKLEFFRQKRSNSLLPALEAPCGNGSTNRASVSDSLYLLAQLMVVQEIALSVFYGNGNDCTTTACCLVALTALLPPAA